MLEHSVLMRIMTIGWFVSDDYQSMTGFSDIRYRALIIKVKPLNFIVTCN